MKAITAIADAWAPRVLSVLRFVTGLVYMEHGTHKMFNFPDRGPHEAYNLMTLTPGVTGVLEVFGGLLIVLGLFTRPAAFILSGEMAIAYWTVHALRSPYPYVNGGDPAILFCFIFLYLACAGGGPWSLDALLRKPKAT